MSCSGGNICLPLSFSFFRKVFRPINAGLVTSSFNSFSQLSCNVSISNFNSSFCSSVKLSTHFSLSKVGGAGAAALPAALAVEESVLGGPKNEVSVPCALGFFASDVGASPALRLRDMVRKRERGRVTGRWQVGRCRIARRARWDAN